MSGRRNELEKKGLIFFLGNFAGYWNGKIKHYKFYSARGDNRTPQQIGWVPWTPKKKEKMGSTKTVTSYALPMPVINEKKQMSLW